MKINMKGNCLVFFLILSSIETCFGVGIERGNQIEDPQEFLLVTVATEETDGFKRFVRSAKFYNVPIEVLGKGTDWSGGSMEGQGGGQKVNLFRRALEKLRKSNPNLIVMFTDGYDVILNEGTNGILEKFKALEAKIVFSAEMLCWPVRSLADSYPPTASPYKYLNSGGFIGYASEIFDLIKDRSIKDEEDDQLYYTKLFLNNNLRKKHKMKLDTGATIFQNLIGAQDDVKLDILDGETVLMNTKMMVRPSVIHGNGLSKLILNSIGNYLAGAWIPEKGCGICPFRSPDEPPSMKGGIYPIVVLSINLGQEVPFLKEFFKKINNLKYPKDRMHLFVYNAFDFHLEVLNEFISENKNKYISFKQILPVDNVLRTEVRNLALDFCMSKKCDYLFNVDGTAHLDNPYTLQYMLEDDRGVVGPMLVRPYKQWSNFWGHLNNDGYYARSFDYIEIVENEKRGIWNVPFLSECYLIKGSLLPDIKGSYQHSTLDPDMAFCNYLREKGIFMFVDNLADYGHLIDADQFLGEKVKNPEFYELLTNRFDWEEAYISPEYMGNFKKENKLHQPCPDVYWFPVVTPRFCKELIDIMEFFGKWSSGNNNDERLAGGYENVPTRDIHMNQVGLEPMWLEFLKQYVRPLQEMVFTGYYHDPPKSLMNFVVRYKPDEQPSLRPHHDSSTYTVNIALNTPKIDYEGGGCHFIRYNCSVTDTKLGWMLMHPGRLTHFHEGLLVTRGTRYIMISFVDP